VEYRDLTKLKGANKRLLASLKASGLEHRNLLASQAKAARDAYDQDVKNYSEALKNAPVDKLGNTIMTPTLQALGAKVQSGLMGKVGPLTKESAGIDVENQIDPATGRLKTQEDDTTPLNVAANRAAEVPAALPSVGERVELKNPDGSSTQVVVEEIRETPQGKVAKIRLQDGSFEAVPVSELSRINLEDPLPGEYVPSLGGDILRTSEQDAIKRLIASNIDF
jgi:hypothetical protein